jgi:hypothetical protein
MKEKTEQLSILGLLSDNNNIIRPLKKNKYADVNMGQVTTTFSLSEYLTSQQKSLQTRIQFKRYLKDREVNYNP